MVRELCVAAACGAVLIASTSAAQDWPARPVRLIVAFPAGGAADLVARSIAQRLTERLGQQVVVDNRSGAGGVIGTELAARAAPDGYTLLFASSSTLANGPAMQRNLPYDPVRDFAPITITTLIPNIIVAHASVPVRSVQEMVEYARSRPGQLSYGSNGNGTASHFAGELFKRAAGMDIVHVPYKGAGVAINDAVGGHVNFLIGAISTSLPHMRAGRLRGIAVTSLKRSAGVPELPTLAESGYPGFDVVQWFGLLAPQKVPAATVARINGDTVAYLRQPEVVERFARQGLDAVAGTSREFADFIRTELARWTRVVKEIGLRPEG